MLPFALPFFLENGRDLEFIGLVVGAIFWFQMIRLCALREPPSLQKILWLAFMIVVPGIGALFYFFLRVTQPRHG